MFGKRWSSIGIGLAVLLTGLQAAFGQQGHLKTLPGHVPHLPLGLVTQGRLPLANHLRLAIGLPLRDPSALEEFLAQAYDPASTNFHQFLTPNEFTERFGPTVADYQGVLDFARTNGLSVTGTSSNRLLLDVEGSVSNLERAFHVKLFTYQHPTENRQFFAPDVDPSVDSQLAIADVSGLNNYVLPKPRLRNMEPSGAGSGGSPRTGSSPGGAYMGNDFRAAYLPGVTLTGSGQMVGLLEFDGFYTSDIVAYETATGLPNVPLQTVLLDGYNGTPTTGANSGNNEVSLDIEMAIAMAPGLAKVVVFEAGPNGSPNDLLNSMAANTQVKQFACSWGWGGGPSVTTDNIFKQMAAQGQSFFTASGDSDAYTTGANSANGVDNTSLANAPSSSPYITVVGGTTLSTSGPGGPWTGETVWNWGLHNGSYSGSSGGISSYYAMPAWQTGVSMASNGGSGTQRNLPDVALTADNVYVRYGNGSSGALGGTSCAAPLWAGVAATANQQAQAAGKSALGFLNPALYAIGKSSGYGQNFHDVTTGNNVSSGSPNLFYASAGFDLCTGWGTPAGQPLIDSLSGAANALAVAPATGFTSAGAVNGPFAPTSQTLVLTNSSAAPITWSLVNTSAWLNVSSSSGTLAGRTTTQISAILADPAYRLPAGAYETALIFTNHSGGVFAISYDLLVGQSTLENGGFESGYFSGWTFSGNTVISGNVYNAVEDASSGFTTVHSGSYGAFLGDTNLASLSQSFASVPGQYYLLSLWMDNPNVGAGQRFIVKWQNGNSTPQTLYSVSSPPSFSWTNLQFLVSATTGTTTLQIQAENDSSYFGLDDVSVLPIQAPVFQSFARSGNDVHLSWATTPGLSYQVQSATNALHPNWVNLGSSFVANSYSSSTVDASAFSVSTQKFYRLVVTP